MWSQVHVIVICQLPWLVFFERLLKIAYFMLDYFCFFLSWKTDNGFFFFIRYDDGYRSTTSDGYEWSNISNPIGTTSFDSKIVRERSF
jgi:hypothetical protein